ncbi:MAG: family 10 glycosylhydrolase [Acutalibacteraceae bacterium]|nr:family 10 glycosylhydrolase [Acutalibacteraceae bacterium]
MKKLFTIILIFSLLSSCAYKESNPYENETKDSTNSSLKGIWLSCYELDFSDKSEKGFTTNINKIFSDIKAKGFNAVFVHVRSHADAYYSSKYFPTSAFISKKQGEILNFDPLNTMCYFAKIYKLEIHAWINPFRITSTTDLSALAENNPALKMIKSNSREVRLANGGYYFNPAYESVRKLILNGVEEVAKNYPVDGIHFDDYFYPTTEKEFDDQEYEKYKKTASSPLSLYDFRRDNINKLIKDVYKTCHKYGKIFGVSPHCSFYYNYNTQYADIEKWCNEKGYIDYIAPQIYFGFKTNEKTEDNQPLKFKACLDYWLERTKNKPIYIGLALYKCGTDNEWANYDNIIARQIKYLNTKLTNGFIVFSYSYLKQNKSETENMQKAIINMS